jgi:hypothetical protein
MGFGNLLCPACGVFVNVNGQTGELIQDPNTGETKIVIGSNQPIGGGPGGTTAQGTSATSTSSVGGSINAFFTQYPWAIPAAIFIAAILTILAFTGGKE